MSASRSKVNRQVRLASRPVGVPQASHFELVDAPIPVPNAGEVLINVHYVSVDPAMRGWVNAAANYAEPVAIGAVMRSFAVGRVVASKHPAYREGDAVTGMFGWQQWAAVGAAAIERKLEPAIFEGLPMSTALGVLGLNGITAYFGLLDVGSPKPGHTVVVSAGAGSVGSCVGQIARIAGCRAVAIAGGPTKTAMCREEFGFDASVDYKAGKLGEELRRACPNGIDVYFDNTAGVITDTCLALLNTHARVVVCGTVAHTEWDPPPLGPRVERRLLVTRSRIEGFVIFDYQHRYAEALVQLSRWVRAGQIRYREEVLEGLEAAPDSIAGLYRGDNLGKRLIRVADDA
jgi:NADPH-dependent curcumin reductase CurA